MAVSALPALASGLAEYTRIEELEHRRVAAVHAAANATATGLFALSWRARRNHRLLGILLANAGSLAATAGGALGGHLAFAFGVGGPAGQGDAHNAGPEPLEDDLEGSEGITSEARRTSHQDVVS